MGRLLRASICVGVPCATEESPRHNQGGCLAQRGWEWRPRPGRQWGALLPEFREPRKNMACARVLMLGELKHWFFLVKPTSVLRQKWQERHLCPPVTAGKLVPCAQGTLSHSPRSPSQHGHRHCVRLPRPAGSPEPWSPVPEAGPPMKPTCRSRHPYPSLATSSIHSRGLSRPLAKALLCRPPWGPPHRPAVGVQVRGPVISVPRGSDESDLEMIR